MEKDDDTAQYRRCASCFEGWFGDSGSCPSCGGSLVPDPLDGGFTFKMLHFLQAVKKDARRER